VEFLKIFEGYLHADAFAGYDGIYAAGSVRQVLCWAHARRKFYDARTVQPEVAHMHSLTSHGCIASNATLRI
jgi:transposase